MRVVFLKGDMEFPDAAFADAEGLVAVGGDFSVSRLLQAYRKGLFPWTVDPITWWSPDPRAIFELDQFHVSRSLRRELARGAFSITRNQAFKRVIEGCAAPTANRTETWITPEFLRAYQELHYAGYAHSVECWLDTQLVGGIYGVALGAFFAGESMFHTVSNASKVALFHLVQHLSSRHYQLFDIQMVTPITKQLGAVCIPRLTYLQRLQQAIAQKCTF